MSIFLKNTHFSPIWKTCLGKSPVAHVANGGQVLERDGAVLDGVADQFGDWVQEQPVVVDSGHPEHVGHDLKQGANLWG